MRQRPIIHVALFFILTLVGLGVLRSGGFAHGQTLLWGLMVVQLVWAAWLYPISKVSLGNFQVAFFIFIIVQALQYGTNVHSFAAGSFSAFDLFRYMIFIALVEELWFRGVLQDNVGGSPLVGICICAVVFGLFHIQQGWGTVLTTTAVGFLFSVARACGAGIIALTLAHGTMNWLNNSFLPPVGLRLEITWFYAVFALGCLVGGSLLYIYYKKRTLRVT